jgi:peptide-methionine (S)-S-oxide reductase
MLWKVTGMASLLFRILALCLITATTACNEANAVADTIPDPIVDAPLASEKGKQTAAVAGGCFWGIEEVFEHVKGVIDVRAGYAGGTANTARYEMVSTGKTRHAESVRITYDPSKISYGQLLKVFFSVAHDPTQLNRQGPDTGPQYRSAIFYSNDEQKRIAQAYIEQLNQAKAFARPIVTEAVALSSFYEAEAYHQDYALYHRDEPYIRIHDLPKVANLRKQFPDLYKSR